MEEALYKEHKNEHPIGKELVVVNNNSPEAVLGKEEQAQVIQEYKGGIHFLNIRLGSF